jgi:hypothetical protein
MEDGLEQNMGNYNVQQQLNPGKSAEGFEKVVYLCIIRDEGGVKKYIISDNIEKVHKFSKNLNCKIEICKINGENGYYESTCVKVTNIVNE